MLIVCLQHIEIKCSIMFAKHQKHVLKIDKYTISSRPRRVLFMFLGSNIRSVGSIENMSQEFKSETLTNPKGAGLFLIDLKVGYPQINL